MKNKELKRKLNNLKKISTGDDSLVIIEKNLKKYMDFYQPQNTPKTTPKTISPYYSRSPFFKAMIAVLVFVFIIGASGQAVFASQSSLPGDSLYPIKIMSENIRGALIFNKKEKAEFEISLAEKRIAEIKKMEEKEKFSVEEIEKTKTRLNEHLHKAQKLSNPESTEFKDKINKNIKIIEEKIESRKEKTLEGNNEKVNENKNPANGKETDSEDNLNKEDNDRENKSIDKNGTSTVNKKSVKNNGKQGN